MNYLIVDEFVYLVYFLSNLEKYGIYLKEINIDRSI